MNKIASKSKELTVQTDVQKKLSLIEEKIKNMNIISSTPFKTNGNFRFDEFSGVSTFNIHHATIIDILIKVLADISLKEEAYNKVYTEELRQKSFPVCKIFQFSVTDWRHDVKLRLNILLQQDRLKRLNEAKEKLIPFLTENDRLASALQEVDDLL